MTSKYPKMSSAQFELIARVLRDDAAHLHPEPKSYDGLTQWGKGAYDQWHTVVLNMAAALQHTNSLFNREKFLRACGVQS